MRRNPGAPGWGAQCPEAVLLVLAWVQETVRPALLRVHGSTLCAVLSQPCWPRITQSPDVDPPEWAAPRTRASGPEPTLDSHDSARSLARHAPQILRRHTGPFGNQIIPIASLSSGLRPSPPPSSLQALKEAGSPPWGRCPAPQQPHIPFLEDASGSRSQEWMDR